MSTVLWAHGLIGTEVSTDDSDKHALYKHLDKLDALGRKLGLGSLLDICDTTDLRYNNDEFELPPGVSSTLEVMARDGSWLALPEALRLLEGLLTHLQQHRVRFGLFTNDYAQVVAELEEALRFARTLAAPEAKFNFSIVS